MTMGELMERALKVRTKEEARVFLDEYVESLRDGERGPVLSHREETLRVARKNLAYFAGYYSEADRLHIETLFECAHPVFGPVAADQTPGPEGAYAAGLRRGQE